MFFVVSNESGLSDTGRYWSKGEVISRRDIEDKRWDDYIKAGKIIEQGTDIEPVKNKAVLKRGGKK